MKSQVEQVVIRAEVREMFERTICLSKVQEWRSSSC